jgi:hypothetical protein
MIPPEDLDAIRDRDDHSGAVDSYHLADRDRHVLLAEYDRLHSWTGLMELLDEHWPTDIFPMPESPEHYPPMYVRDPKQGGAWIRANPGARIIGLMRWLDKISKERDQARAKIAEIDQLHHPITVVGFKICDEDEQTWPCGTHSALASADDQGGQQCGVRLGSRPEWMSPDQYEQCTCQLREGHPESQAHRCGAHADDRDEARAAYLVDQGGQHG